jgi:hypothetical protein
MDVKMQTHEPLLRPLTGEDVGQRSVHQWLGVASVALGVGLIANSVLGPMVTDVIDYPWSESIRNQAIGLEAVSLLLVGPLILAAGVLAFRGHLVAPVLAFGPAAYTAYMFVQYVIGPEYGYYAGVLPLHLGLFSLGAGTAVAAWHAMDPSWLRRMEGRSERRHAVLPLLLAAFIVFRYMPALAAAIAGDRLTPEFRRDVSMYWSIVLLDLGIVVPATMASAIALFRRSSWGRKGLYGVVGWFALVPPSVAAMAIAMVVNDDPNAAVGQAIVLTIAAIVFVGFAARLYRPLFPEGPGVSPWKGSGL